MIPPTYLNLTLFSVHTVPVCCYNLVSTKSVSYSKYKEAHTRLSSAAAYLFRLHWFPDVHTILFDSDKVIDVLYASGILSLSQNLILLCC